jgi:hypothetical protein
MFYITQSLLVYLFDSCDKENGVCTDTSGCKPGWRYEQLKCDKGMKIILINSNS